mmetsp:Transcript_15926/g.27430  ORF Transcript_15926/g.27430 Transcript_15926/m.27430 type:complete len:141 (-) Transcript_15926:226-648(-)
MMQMNRGELGMKERSTANTPVDEALSVSDIGECKKTFQRASQHGRQMHVHCGQQRACMKQERRLQMLRSRKQHLQCNARNKSLQIIDLVQRAKRHTRTPQPCTAPLMLASCEALSNAPMGSIAASSPTPSGNSSSPERSC